MRSGKPQCESCDTTPVQSVPFVESAEFYSRRNMNSGRCVHRCRFLFAVPFDWFALGHLVREEGKTRQGQPLTHPRKRARDDGEEGERGECCHPVMYRSETASAQLKGRLPGRAGLLGIE